MVITEELVEDALEQMWDYSRVGAHPLVDVLLTSPNGSRSRLGLIERGAEMNRYLIEAIERIKVSKEHAPKSRERRYFQILSGCFIDRRTNRDVARALSVSERTFYRERANALMALTRVLSDDAANRG